MMSDAGDMSGWAAGAGRRGGSGLIVALWVIGLLSLLVTSFAFDAHIEARITSYYRKRMKAQHLAHAGVEMAEFLMRKSLAIKSAGTTEDIEEEWWFADAELLSKGLPIRNLDHELGAGKIVLTIEPEPARRNVNKLGNTDREREEAWERILDVGGIAEEVWPELIESFLDWTDKDETPRTDGAETDDYYGLLDSPYTAKNGPLDTVEELLLVKGFDRTILFGGVIDLGIEGEDPVSVRGFDDLLTTYGDGKVNVNAATVEVLMTLPGVDEVAAQEIIYEIQDWVNDAGDVEPNPYSNPNDFIARNPGLSPALKAHVVTDSAIFRVTSTGVVQGVARRLWAIVEYQKGKLRILRWREEG